MLKDFVCLKLCPIKTILHFTEYIQVDAWLQKHIKLSGIHLRPREDFCTKITVGKKDSSALIIL